MSKRGRIPFFVLLFPALLFLGALVVYPLIASTVRSLYDAAGTEYVGLANYRAIFTNPRMLQAVINNFLWVAIYPIAVTVIGLVFAVLSERIGWRALFKLLVFLPMVISVMAGGIIWRIVFEQDPNRGMQNALLSIPMGWIRPAGQYAGAVPSTDQYDVTGDRSVALQVEVGQDGAVALLGLSQIRPGVLPEDATQAATPQPRPGAITGVVWRDAKPGQDVPGEVEEGELGLPGVPVELVADGSTVGRAETDLDGSFLIEGVEPGTYRARIPGEVFRSQWQGISWLGPAGLTRYGPHMGTIASIIAQIWIFTGFGMVTIGAGLAALPRELLEAARVDGASEWQVFRQVTVPLLRPVLIVVFITLVIGALKVFDIIFALVPGSVQDEANVIALEQWRVAFIGLGDKGLGSAIAVFLFLLVMPILVLNVRRFQLERQ